MHLNDLLKRREELLKAKEEIERKLKLAIKVKKLTEENSSVEFEEDKEEEQFENGAKKVIWDNVGKLLAVLTDFEIILKSFNPLNPFTKKVIKLPMTNTERIFVSNNLIGLSTSEGTNYFHAGHEEAEWRRDDCDENGKLVWINSVGIFLIYNQKFKRILVKKFIFKSESFIEITQIDHVESFHSNNENEDMVLFTKTDGSLSI